MESTGRGGTGKDGKKDGVSPDQRTSLSIRMQHKKPDASSNKLSEIERLKADKYFEKLKMKWWEMRKQKRLRQQVMGIISLAEFRK